MSRHRGRIQKNANRNINLEKSCKSRHVVQFELVYFWFVFQAVVAFDEILTGAKLSVDVKFLTDIFLFGYIHR
jgi:hypothetical protein